MQIENSGEIDFELLYLDEDFSNVNTKIDFDAVYQKISMKVLSKFLLENNDVAAMSTCLDLYSGEYDSLNDTEKAFLNNAAGFILPRIKKTYNLDSL